MKFVEIIQAKSNNLTSLHLIFVDLSSSLNMLQATKGSHNNDVTYDVMVMHYVTPEKYHS